MASTVVNTPAPFPTLKRGVPFQLGTMAGTASVFAFTCPDPAPGSNGTDVLTIVAVGGTLTLALEGSIDGGTTWFGVPARPSGVTITTTTLNADTAASGAATFEVSGLQAGTLFRAGSSAAVTGNPVLWALIG